MEALSRSEETHTGASSQEEKRESEENSSPQPSGSASEGSMDPHLAVECGGAVWIQALHLLNRLASLLLLYALFHC